MIVAPGFKLRQRQDLICQRSGRVQGCGTIISDIQQKRSRLIHMPIDECQRQFRLQLDAELLLVNSPFILAVVDIFHGKC